MAAMVLTVSCGDAGVAVAGMAAATEEAASATAVQAAAVNLRCLVNVSGFTVFSLCCARVWPDSTGRVDQLKGPLGAEEIVGDDYGQRSVPTVRVLQG